VHPYYGPAATETLLKYRSSAIAQQLLARVSRQDSMKIVARYMQVMADDSIYPMTRALRDSVARAATQLVYASDARWRTTALLAIAQRAELSDVPALIGALTLDENSYAVAVVALVELTGDGFEAMPKGRGSSADRAAAQRWWSAWYETHRGFKTRSRNETQAQVAAMRRRLDGY